MVQKGAPLRLNMWGVNLYTGGHFDLYVADYYDYKVSLSLISTNSMPMRSPSQSSGCSCVDGHLSSC